MGIKQYIELLKAKIITIIAVTLIFALAGFVGTSLQKPVYQASSSIAVTTSTPVKQQQVDFFLYDNFYSVQSGSYLAESVASWLTSPSVVADIFKTAGFQLPPVDARKLGKTFTALKQNTYSAVVDFSTKDGNRDKAGKLVASANDVLTKMVKGLGSDDKTGITYETVTSQPVVIEVPKKTMFNTVLAAIGGLIVSIALVTWQNFLKNEQ